MYEVRVFPAEADGCVECVKIGSVFEAVDVAALIDRLSLAALYIEVVDTATGYPVRTFNG